jgi:hypothetical protein
MVNEHIDPIDDPQILKEYREIIAPVGEDHFQNDLDEQIERMDQKKLLYISENDATPIVKAMLENKGKLLYNHHPHQSIKLTFLLRHYFNNLLISLHVSISIKFEMILKII